MGAVGKAAGRGKGRLGSAGSAHPGKPAKGRGRASWWDIARRAWAEFWEDQIPMIAAGTTFYALLAIFPAIGLFVSLWGLFGDVGDAHDALAQLATILPGGALTVVGDQMARVAAGNSSGLTLAAAFGLLLSIWSANGAMSAIITGLNMAYGLKEERGFVRRTLVALAFTLALIGFWRGAVPVPRGGVGRHVRDRPDRPLFAVPFRAEPAPVALALVHLGRQHRGCRLAGDVDRLLPLCRPFRQL
jgi:membrane protein